MANAWLTADAGERQCRWRALLPDEPALALWSALSASSSEDAGPPSLDRLVDGCERHSRECFAACGAPHALAGERASTRDAVSLKRDARDLALRAAQRAARGDARRLSGSDWVAEWLGDGLEWLALAAVPGEVAAADMTAVPRWLKRRDARPVELLPALPADRAAAVRDRWEASGPAVNLESLAASLHEARRLANEFSSTLEMEKLAALREFAYGASHEINNPLANIATRAQTLLRDERDLERRRSLAVMASQAMRAHTMIADVMLFAKPPALRRVPIRLTEVLDRVVAELREMARLQGTVIARVGDGADDEAVADAEQLAVALRAIVENALEALGSGGSVELTFERTAGPGCAAADRGGYRILVRDTGPGIPPTVRRHLFDPYYSGREAGRGLGVGLCKAWRIVTDHGGRIEVAHGDGRGTVFALEIPAGPSSAERAK